MLSRHAFALKDCSSHARGSQPRGLSVLDMAWRSWIVVVALLGSASLALAAQKVPSPRPKPQASTDLPLPRGKTLPPPEDQDLLEISDGVSLEPKLGREDNGPSGMTGLTGKRRAYVPPTTERDMSSPLRHGLSDGASLGLNFSFETK